MVTTEDEEVFWVLDLVCEQQTDGLQRLLSSIYVVAKEEVVRLRRETTVFEEPEKIIVLTVNIAANLFATRLAISAPPIPPLRALIMLADEHGGTYLYRRLELKQNGL